uniref:Alpha 1,4-glycosyltransferase domain-containing protein n=1 Tax=Lotharella globosa TaxID=91324 RepID=A0A7S3YSQ7_9EUKA
MSDYKLVFWDDSDNQKFIDTRFPVFSYAYSMMKPVEKADFARYGYLYAFGGVYADMDNKCIRTLDKLKHKHGYIAMEPLLHAVLLEHRFHQFASNALMASRKGHVFWLYLMTAIVIKSGKKGDPVSNTGPRKITKAHQAFFMNSTTAANKTDGGAHGDGDDDDDDVGDGHAIGMIDIMPEEYFMPEPAWWNIDAMRKTCLEAEFDEDERVLQVCKELERRYDARETVNHADNPNTYSVHNWRCTWCRGTGTEIFVNITSHPKLREGCLKPVIEPNEHRWIKC